MEQRTVCDFCFKEPTEIDAENGICYYFVIPKENGEAAALMSSGHLAFRLWNAKEHPVEDDKIYVCEKCYEENTKEDSSVAMSNKQTKADELTEKVSHAGFIKYAVEHDQVDLNGSFSAEDLRKFADDLDVIKNT